MRCPTCKKQADAKYRPFCSKRCADVDLGRWMNESYSVPATSEDDMQEAAEALVEQTQKPH